MITTVKQNDGQSVPLWSVGNPCATAVRHSQLPGWGGILDQLFPYDVVLSQVMCGMQWPGRKLPVPAMQKNVLKNPAWRRKKFRATRQVAGKRNSCHALGAGSAVAVVVDRDVRWWAVRGVYVLDEVNF